MIPRPALLLLSLAGAACTAPGNGGDAGVALIDAGRDSGAPDADAGPHDAGGDGGQPGGPLDGGACPPLSASVVEGRLGPEDDTAAEAVRVLVLMGGSVEVDGASRSFVEAAGGGDILVLRASGSVNTYTPYFADELGADPDATTVRTLLLDSSASAGDPGVHCRVAGAEALWLAGGDQADYLLLWPASLHAALDDVAARGAAMGGTSAGAMVLGSVAFSAASGSVTSSEALAGPAGPGIALLSPLFAQPELDHILVDTHFTERNREGRLLAFLARAMADAAGPDGGVGPAIMGLGLDEETALVIEEGTYRVVATDGGAVFVYSLSGPVVVEAGQPLSAEGILRLRLEGGATGPWPPDLDALSPSALRVRSGVVEAP